MEEARHRRVSGIAIALATALLVVGIGTGYLIGHSGASTTTTTTTVATSTTSIFTYTFTQPSISSISTSECTISAEGAVQFRVISDTSGQVIQGAKLNGTLHNQCGDFKTDTFTPQSGGWFSPVLNATMIGYFIVSVQYSGKTYSYAASIAPQMATCVTLGLPSGNFSSARGTIGNGASCPTGSESRIRTTTGVTYTVDAILVSRFCTNSSAIPTNNSSREAASLTLGGESFIGFFPVGIGIMNGGSAPVSIRAVCLNAIGVVPSNNTIVGPTATTLQFGVSPSGPLLPGRGATVYVNLTGGSHIYFKPQSGVAITVITGDGSSLSEVPYERCCTTTTGSSPTEIVSIQNISLHSGKVPVLSAIFAFNTTSPIEKVDIFVNGQYVGSVGVGHDSVSPTLYSVDYTIRFDEPSRLVVTAGKTYWITFTAATGNSLETTVSANLVAS